jgi:hypothetical protein
LRCLIATSITILLKYNMVDFHDNSSSDGCGCFGQSWRHIFDDKNMSPTFAAEKSTNTDSILKNSTQMNRSKVPLYECLIQS